MNTQLNLRLPDNLLKNARKYASSKGFGNVQELIKEVLREKIFEQQEITREEFVLISKLIRASKKNNLYGTEKELFEKLSK